VGALFPSPLLFFDSEAQEIRVKATQGSFIVGELWLDVDTQMIKFWQYIPARGTANLASLFLAVLYSRDLGVTNRGIIAAIMSFSVISIIALLGGTTLTLRQIGLQELNPELKKSLCTLLPLLVFVGFSLYILSIYLYSNFRSEIPSSLVYLSLIYFFASASQYIVLEFLLSQKNFRAAGKIEIYTIVLQISNYTALSTLDLFSSAINLLLSFSFSYCTISFYVFRKYFSSSIIRFGLPQLFFQQTKGKHSLGVALNFLDRLDRIFIAWFFPSAILGQYATMSGFLSVARFFPDAISRMRMAGYRFDTQRRFRKPLVIMSSTLILGVIGVLVARYSISWSLGPEWLLSIPVFIIFCSQEVARGVFQFLANHQIKNDQPQKAHNSSLMLAILILPALLLFSQSFGIIGVPLAFLVCYIFSILASIKVWTRSA
jgi:hypothetical protein